MDTPFGRAQRAFLRMMRTRMWQKAMAEEDPLMVAHFPQLSRFTSFYKHARSAWRMCESRASMIPRTW